MGKLIRSENSLNQHVKLKHEELWKKMKTPGLRPTENIYYDDKEDMKKEDVYTFKIEDEKNENQEIDFDKILENF